MVCFRPDSTLVLSPPFIFFWIFFDFCRRRRCTLIDPHRLIATQPHIASMSTIKDHYEVLDVARDADASQIKKAHRKKALKWHPDKNPGDELAAETFQYIQQAYECLSDPAERKWYDEHREAILNGWSADGGNGGNGQQAAILFDVVPFMHPGCYSGYGHDDEGFYGIYNSVFSQIYEEEMEGWQSEGNIEEMPLHDLPTNFGTDTSEWSEVVGQFYTLWESFSSCRAFAWADKYDSKDADDRRMRRAMEDENRKARRVAKRKFTEDVLALVHFVKRRDPRVKAQKEKVEQDKARKKEQDKQDTKRKKQMAQEAREQWRIESEERMLQEEANDLAAGRIRLADLDDDYDYGGKRGRKGKKNKPQYNFESSEEEEEDEEETEVEGEGLESAATGVVEQVEGEAAVKEAAVDAETTVGEEETTSEKSTTDDEEQVDEAVDEVFEEEEEFYSSEEEESLEEEEPELWRCESCRKDFKSKAQMENHKKSKKHKDTFKKWQNKQRKEELVMEDLLEKLDLDPESK
jgi:DnaJ family protein A protein 5